MKKTILILAFLLPVLVYGQTRIRDLATQATYDGSAYVPVDKAGFTTTKKMLLSTLTGTEATTRANNDTITRRGVGLADSGNYLTDELSHYITGALMAGYDTNSVVTAIHMLDSILYATNLKTALWDTGSVGTSVQMHNTGNTAFGSYSLASNYYTVAKGAASASFGSKSVALYNTSVSLAGGSYLAKYGASQTVEFVARGESKAGTGDTLEINAAYPITIPTDAVIGFEITIVGVQKAGVSGTLGNGFYQKWTGCIRNDAGTTAFIGTPDSTTAKRSAGEISQFTLVADDTLEQLDIISSGGAGRDVEYTAYVRFVITGYRKFNLGY